MDDRLQPGVSTLDRLVELTREVDFAAFVFAQDDWTAKGAAPDAAAGQASPRDNVVFEAGLFGGALGMRRTFILHANGAKLPTDLLGLTTIRYDPDTTPAIVRQINQKLRKAIEAEGRISRLEGDWWQLSLTARTELEPSAVSLLTISRDRAGALEVAGRSWQADGTLSARYWSEASKERVDPAGIFYFWKGERPRHPDAPQLEGTGEIKLESVDRADGYFTHAPTAPTLPRTHIRRPTSAPTQATTPSLDGTNATDRAALIQGRLEARGALWRTSTRAASSPQTLTASQPRSAACSTTTRLSSVRMADELPRPCVSCHRLGRRKVPGSTRKSR